MPSTPSASRLHRIPSELGTIGGDIPRYGPWRTRILATFTLLSTMLLSPGQDGSCLAQLAQTSVAKRSQTTGPPQEPAATQDQSPDGDFHRLFADRFADIESLENYQTQGPTKLTAGKVVLPQGASLIRPSEAGNWARVELNLDLPAPTEQEELTDLRIWLLMRGATNCFVQIRQHLPDAEGNRSSLAVIDTAVTDGKTSFRVMRFERLRGPVPPSLRIDYRHGLISVSASGQRLLQGYVENAGAPIGGVGVVSAAGNFKLRAFSVSKASSIPTAPIDAAAAQRVEAAQRELLRHYRDGSFEQASIAGERALKLARDTFGSSHAEVAKSLNNLAVIADRLGDYVQAIQFYEQAVSINRHLLGDQHPRYATSIHNLALVHHNTGDHHRALTLLHQVLAIENSVLGSNHPALATTLESIGAVHVALGEYADAEPLFQRAIAIHERTQRQQRPEHARALNHLAGLYAALGDLDRAEPLYERVLKLRQQLHGTTHSDYAETLNDRACLAFQQGHYDQALRQLQSALRIRTEILGIHHPLSAETLNNLMVTYVAKGQFEQGAELISRALEITESELGTEHPNYADMLSNLGALQFRRGDYASSRTQFERVIQIEQSSKTTDPLNLATSLNNLAAACQRTGAPQTANEFFHRASVITRESLELSAVIQSERQQRQNQRQNRPFLDSWLSHAITTQTDPEIVIREIWRWKGAVSTRQAVYRRLAAHPQLVAPFAELQAVTRNLSAMRGFAPTEQTSSATDTEQQAHVARVARWKQTFTRFTAQRESLEQRIASGSRAFRDSRQELTVATVQSWLPERAAYVDFLEYNHGTPVASPSVDIGPTAFERRFVACIIRPNQQPALVATGSASELETLIEQFRLPFDSQHDTSENRRLAQLAGHRIRDLVWAPLETYLNEAETVVLSPDTILGTLPFAALPGRHPGRYLVEDYRLASVPNVQSLRPHQPAEPASDDGNSILIVGDVDYEAQPATDDSSSAVPSDSATLVSVGRQPAYDLPRTRVRRKWKRLAGFRAELEAIRTLHNDSADKRGPLHVLSGSEASKRRFLKDAGQSRVLHIVTHGYFEDPSVTSTEQAQVAFEHHIQLSHRIDPFINTWIPSLLSGLAMAGANVSEDNVASDSSEDGILRAAEIESTSLANVDLVVLSACETGLGPVAGGEGLTGLQRAFQVAGARTVIASLWQVSDKATVELMKQFYRNLWIKKMPRLDALRQAQLDMLDHYDAGSGEFRGLGSATVPVRSTGPLSVDDQGQRLPPRYWAAFQLSGDWR